MTKQEQFLWIVQTTILANAVNLASQAAVAEKYRHVISATGVIGLAADAVWASGRIPDDKSAIDAADEFCGFMLNNWRDQTESAGDEKMQLPAWLSRS